MLIYEADKKQFLEDNDYRLIHEVIEEKYKQVTGKSVSPSEINSWSNSLRCMAIVLRDKEIEDHIGVAIELQLPQSSKRIDMTLTGFNNNKNKSAVVIELKQWEKIELTTKDAIVKTRLGKGIQETVHPSYQAWSYVSLLEGFNESVYNGSIGVKGCAYLHNYEADGLIDHTFYEAHIAKAPVFLKGLNEIEKLRHFIKSHVKYGDNKSVLYELDSGKIRPSKALANSLVELIKGKEEFVLIDDQKSTFETCLEAAKVSALKPNVIIIEGGPGTGKTVLAINLLVKLTALQQNCKYVSKNAAPRTVYQNKLTGTIKKTHFGNFFSGSGAFISNANDVFDTLIIDEAHRLNEKSGLYSNLGENQIKELINAARCSIFFIDEDQRIAINDIGTKEAITKFAQEKNANIINLSLSSQFRCSGSDGYLSWLDNSLNIRPTANPKLSKLEYDFKVFDSVVEMHEEVKKKNSLNSARVVAGYCWPWSSKKDANKFDIHIGDNYKRKWNLAEDGSLWIMAENSIEEVGCIHTCQGLEVDYIGVIIGPDLIVRNGNIITLPNERDTHDKTLKGFKKMFKENPIEAKKIGDRIIKNTYRTLMTRGMKGCYLYCTDEETRTYFKNLLE